MIEHSADITKFGAALVTAQGMMTGAKRDAKNPHFKSTYATLETVIDTAKPALQEVGIAFMQAPGQLIDGALEVTTMLMHAESGQWMRSTLHVPLAKRDPQGVGSAITYACRYSLMAMLGLPPTDDDGHAAVNSTAPQPEPARKNDNARAAYTMLQNKLRSITTRAELSEWLKDPTVAELGGKLPADWAANFKKEIAEHKAGLSEGFAPVSDAFPGDIRTNQYAQNVSAG
jgi:hypothetical protein